MNRDKNSMLYWFPRVKNTGVPVPKTIIVEVPNFNYLEIIENPGKFPKDVLRLLKRKAREIGYPIFVRTDHLSGKHSYPVWAPYVEKEKDLLPHILLLIEASATAGIFGLPINAFVIREFLDLEWKFKAFCGMPIAKERRYFIHNGRVICHHPYWPVDAIRFWKVTDPPKNWKKMLHELNRETPDEVDLLTSYAEKVAAILEGYWSVDFAKAKNGTWYLIDCALGVDSWHPPCKKRLKFDNAGLP